MADYPIDTSSTTLVHVDKGAKIAERLSATGASETLETLLFLGVFLLAVGIVVLLWSKQIARKRG